MQTEPPIADDTQPRTAPSGSPRFDLSWALPGPKPVSTRRWLRVGALALIFVAGLVLLCRFDLTLVRSIDRMRDDPGHVGFWSLDSLFRGFRAFAEIVVLISVLLAIAALDRRRRLVLAHVLFALFLAWAFQGLGKGFVVRLRPNAYDGQAWAGMWQGIEWAFLDARRASFPSGHTTVAFAFALTLAWFYRRLTWLFWALAVGCGASRVLHGVHWVSDCWTGAWLGYIASWVALRPHWFHPLIQRWHHRGRPG